MHIAQGYKHKSEATVNERPAQVPWTVTNVYEAKPLPFVLQAESSNQLATHGNQIANKDKLSSENVHTLSEMSQVHMLFIHSFIPAISIAPLQVLYYSEALPTTARILYRSFTPKRTGNCR